MKVKVNWKELGKQLWAAVKPVLLAAIGGGIVSVAAGCSSLTPSSKVQSMGVYAFGLPAVAIITQSEQIAPRVAAPPGSLARGGYDYSGGDTNGVSQANPVTTIVPISAAP